MKKRNKIIALIVSLVFVVALSVSFTAAYLTAKTDTVTNTFTATTSLVDGEFTLKETDSYELGANGFVLTGDHKTSAGVNYTGVMPSMTIEKDPLLTINLATDAHIFLKVVATNMTAAADTDLDSWVIDDGWRLVAQKTDAGVTSYLYVKAGVTAKADAEEIAVLKNNVVNVRNYGAEPADLALAAQQASLKFSAYAIQAFKVNVVNNENALAVFKANFDNDFVADVAPDNI